MLKHKTARLIKRLMPILLSTVLCVSSVPAYAEEYTVDLTEGGYEQESGFFVDETENFFDEDIVNTEDSVNDPVLEDVATEQVEIDFEDHANEVVDVTRGVAAVEEEIDMTVPSGTPMQIGGPRFLADLDPNDISVNKDVVKEGKAEARSVDVLVVVDLSGSMKLEFPSSTAGFTRMDALKGSLKAFLDKLAELNEPLPEADKSRVGIIGFSGNGTIMNADTTPESDYLYTLSDYTTLNSTGLSTLKTIADGLEPKAGKTDTGAAMDMAVDLVNSHTTDKKQFVVLFTDGYPNKIEGFQVSVANRAIAAAKTLKESGVDVYVVSIEPTTIVNPTAMPTLYRVDGDDAGNKSFCYMAPNSVDYVDSRIPPVNLTDDQIASNNNYFLELVSSNNPHASSMFVPNANDASDGGQIINDNDINYVIGALDEESLNKAFESIADNVGVEKTYKVVKNPVFDAGQIVEYRIRLDNHGTQRREAHIIDPISSNLEVITSSISHNGTYDGTQIIWNVSVAGNSTRNVSFKARVKDSAAGKKITNKAEVKIGSYTFEDEEDIDVSGTYKIDTEVINGFITDSMTDIPEGESRTVEYEPLSEDYYLESVTVDNESKELVGTTTSQVQFENIDADHAVKVIYQPYFKVETSVVNGTITESIFRIKNGETKTVSYSPNPGYKLASVTIDGSDADITSNPENVEFKNIAMNHTVHVVYEKNSHKITTEVTNGTITDDQIVEDGEDSRIEFSPNSGYSLTKITVDNEDLNISGDESAYDFINVTEDHDIKVVYERIQHKVTTEAINGTISDDVTVNEGDDTDVTFSPNAGYHLTELEVDGEKQDISGDEQIISFTNIVKDHHVKAVFDKNEYTITTEVVNGAITPTSKVQDGDDKKISYEPAEKHHLISVTVDGEPVEISDYPDEYDFTDVHEDHTIRVVYEIDKYKIETSVIGGTITPSSEQEAWSDAEVKYSPNEGYYLVSVEVDGENVDINEYPSEYDFTNILSNHKVHVVYEPYHKITTEVIGGTITDDIENIRIGEDKLVEFKPDNEDKILIDIEVDGNPEDIKEKPEDYSFNDVRDDHHIKVVYADAPEKEVKKGEKDVEKNVFYVGQNDEITYVVSWTNPSDRDLDVTLTDKVPENVAFVSASDEGKFENKTVTWNLQAKAGETISVSFNVKLTGTKSSTIRNQAELGNDDFSSKTNEVLVYLAKLPEKTVKTPYDVLAAKPGDELTYTISFDNPMDETRSFTVRDRLQSGLKFISASNGGTYDEKTRIVTWKLDVEAKKDCELTLVVSPDETLAGKIVKNSADITSKDYNPPSPKAPDVPVFENPVKSVTDESGKDINGEFVKAGETITYHIKAKNPMGESADAELSDKLPEGLEFVEASDGGKLDKSGNIVWTFEFPALSEKEVTVKALVKESAAGTTISNNAELRFTNDNIVLKTNTVNNPVVKAPEKSVANASGENIDTRMVKAGDTLVYTITVKNPSDKELGAAVNDKLPDGVEAVEISDDGKQGDAGIQWNIKVPGGSEKKLTVKARVLDSAKGSALKNKANMIEDGRKLELPSNEVVNHVLTDLSKEVLNEKGQDIHDMPVKEGDILTYRITVKNPEENEIEASIKDAIPEGLEISEISDGGKAEGQNIVWTLKLAGKEEKSVTIKAKVLSAAYGKILKNKAVVEFPGNVTQETNEVKNPVLKAPVKHVLDANGKDIDKKMVNAGDKLTYTITVENPSDNALEMTLSDMLQSGLTAESISDEGTVSGQVITWKLSMAAGASKTVQFVVTVPESARGSIIKNAAVLTVPRDKADEISIPTNEVQNPVISKPVKAVIDSSKKDINGSQVYTGDTITYTIKVHNPASEAKTFTVTDALPAGTAVSSPEKDIKVNGNTITWNGSIEAGKDKILTINAKISAAEGELVNKANVVADDIKIDTNEVKNPVGTSVSVLKTDEYGKALSGATLQIKDSSGKVVQEWTSTGEAYVMKGKLAAGANYVLHEQAAPSGYDLASDISFTVNKSGETAQIVMKDKKTEVKPVTPAPTTTTTATPAPAAAPIPVQSTVVYRNTGDSSTMVLWTAGILAAAAAAFIFFKKKKHA